MGSIVLSKGLVATVDDDDLPWLSGWKWSASFTSKTTVYAVTGAGKSRLVMHRLLLKAGPGQVVDHIDGDTLNNRRQNLRICSAAQNAFNARLSAANTSGFKGVHRRSNGLWRAVIKVDGKNKHLGIFQRAEDAARAYDEACRIQYGDFAKPNFGVGGLHVSAPGQLP